MDNKYYSTEMRLDADKLTVMDVFRWERAEDPEGFCDFMTGKRIIRAAYDGNGNLLMMLSDDKSGSPDYLVMFSDSDCPQIMTVNAAAGRPLREYFKQLLNSASSF